MVKLLAVKVGKIENSWRIRGKVDISIYVDA